MKVKQMNELFNLTFGNLFEIENRTNSLKKLRLNFIRKTFSTLMGYWPEGKAMNAPDEKLEEVIERQIYSERVGKRSFCLRLG